MSTLCFGCMQQKENSPVCELCGYNENMHNLPHQLPVGTVLQNQYLVGKVLGQGGFGITYLGWDQNLSVPVAIKEYFPSGIVQRHTQLSTKVACTSGETPELYYKHRDRFLKEARTLAQFAGIPEIVQIRSFFPENDTAYIIMEYVQGITLKEYCKKLSRPMTEAEVLTIMEPVLKAMQTVHDHGLIHRDISPDNIMLPDSGGIKLIDFGTVRYVDPSGKSKSTETILKPGFAPMEQYVTRGNLGTWTDVYALCATFHYLLTGKVPEEAMARLDEDGSLPLLHSRPDLSSRVIAALEKGMQVRIPERIQTVDELYRLLYREQAQKPLTEAASHTKQKAGTKKVLKILPVIGVLILLLMAAGFLGQKSLLEDSLIVPTTAYTEASETVSTPTELHQESSLGMNEMDVRYSEAMTLAQNGDLAQAAIAFGKLGNYRDARDQSFALWSKVGYREPVAAGYDHFVAIKTDGTAITCCEEYQNVCNVQDWTNLIAVSAADNHIIGLRADGTVVAAGLNECGQCDVSEWQDIVAIATEDYHTVGLKADGTVIATGDSGEENLNPLNRNRLAVEDWTDIIAISINEHQTMGLKLDGTVITTGSSNWEQSELSDWNNVLAIDAANWNAVALLADGTAASTTRFNDWHQCSVSDWSDLVSISGGFHHTVGLKADGTVIATGSNKNAFNNYCGQCNVSEWKDIVFLTAGEFVTVGLRSDGSLVVTGQPWPNDHKTREWTDIMLPE